MTTFNGSKLFLTVLIFGLVHHSRQNVCTEDCGKTDVCPPIISRSEWIAESPKSTMEFTKLPEFVVICHTVTSSCHDLANCSTNIRAIQRYHMDQKLWDDIAYNFLIGEDGAVYEGRGWNYVGSHSRSYNEKSIAIAFIGDFSERVPDQIAIDVSKKLIECGVSKGKISQEYKLVGHKQLIPTNSPGDKLFNEIKTWPRWSTKLNKI